MGRPNQNSYAKKEVFKNCKYIVYNKPSFPLLIREFVWLHKKEERPGWIDKDSNHYPKRVGRINKSRIRLIQLFKEIKQTKNN